MGMLTAGAFSQESQSPGRAGIWACTLALIGLMHSAGAMAGLAASVSLESGAPTSVRPGEITTLEITLSNNDNNSPLNNVRFVPDSLLPGTLPNGLKIAGAATYTCTDPAGPSPTTGPGVGTLTAVVGTQTIALSGGVIPARNPAATPVPIDGTCTILLPVTPGTSTGAATSYTYTIPAGTVLGEDSTPVTQSNVGSVSQSIPVLAIARPQISKSFDNSIAVLGGAPRLLTINVNNPNPVALTNFSITDNFPSQGADGAIVGVVNPGSATTNCPGASFSPALATDATSVTVTGGNLAANTSCSITVQVAARHTDGDYQTNALSNTINAVTEFSNDIGIRAQSNASASIRARSPLNVTKSFSPNSLAQGQSGTMSITLSNTGDTDLVVQSFTDSPIDGIGNTTPSLGLKVNGAIGLNCPGAFAATADNLGITQTSNTTIAAGGSCTITVPFIGQTMAMNTPISYTNSIDEGDVNVGDPTIVSQARTASILIADNLRVLKSRSTNNPRPGNPVRYTITVQNWSLTDLSNVRIQDPLENGMTFLTGIIDGNDFSPVMTGTNCAGLTVNSSTGDATAEMVIGTLPQRTGDSSPGQCAVSFYAMTSTSATTGTPTGNSLGAGSVCTDNGVPPTSFCNGGGASAPSSPVVSEPLAASKSFNPTGPLPEGTITRMTIALSNYSANPLTAVSISDTLPISGSVQMQVANPANAVTTCGAGTITAAPGGSSITLNNGSIAARANLGAGAPGTCTLQVDVVGPAGIYVNTATASGTETYADGSSHTVDPVNATANFTYTSILTSSKSFNPVSASSNGRSTVTVRMANSGPVALTNVAVTDPLPTGMVLANPTNAYTTCSGSTAISGNPGASSIALTGATVAGGSQCELLFDVLATGTSDWINSIPPGGIDAVGTGVINQSAVTATLFYVPGSALTVVKATSPSTLTFPGQTSRLTITLTNGSAAVSNLQLSDYFTVDGTAGAAANGMVLSSSPAASTTCPGGIVTALPGGESLAVAGVSMAAGTSCTISADVTSVVTGGITNYIPGGAISTSEGLSNADEATTSLTTQTNIGLAKQFTPDVIKENERSRLRITLYNPTPRAATALSVTDNLPAGLIVAAGPNPTTTCAGASVTVPAPDQVQLSGGVLGAASGITPTTCYLEIDVTTGTQGSYVNTIASGSLSGDIGGIPTTNSQPASSTLRVGQPLVVHKAIGGFTLDSGNPAGFTTGTAARPPGASAQLVIALENPNSTDLTEVAFIDSLPAGLVVSTTPNASTSCAGGLVTATPAATSVRLTGATVPAAGTCNVTVDVLSNIAGTYLNSIASGAVTSLEGYDNEEASSAELLVSFPPQIGKQFEPAVIPPAPDGISVLTLIFTNENASDITLSSVFTDSLPTLPGTVQVASPANVNNNCTGAVTATPGSGSISLANGSTIPAGGCSISVDVTGSTPGTHTNNIPAGALATTAGSNEEPANADLIVSTEGFISGRVFKDNSLVPDGSFDLGTDDPLTGVTINLHSAADCSGAPSQSVVTDAQGNYVFFGLPAGAYSVCQTLQPAGTVNGGTTAGTITPVLGSTGAAGAASNPTGTTSQVINVVLNGDGTDGAISGSAENNFAEVVLSSIAGQVFLDNNNNGVLNGADAGIAGQLIELLNSGGSVVATTTTGSDGQYGFADLQPGTYSVRQPNQPADTSNGMTVPGSVDNGGTIGTASTPATLPSQISAIVLPPNTDSVENNFAEIPNGRSIGGVVFMDFDDSGTLDGTDYGIGGQTIDLAGVDLNGNAVPPRSTTTAADGSYLFVGLPEGTYTVTQPAQPADTSNGTTVAGSTGGVATGPGTLPSSITSIDLTGVAAISAENNFAEIPDAAPDLTVSKDHSPASFGLGSTTGYFTITPANIGSFDTSGTITVTDTLPAGMTLAAVASGTDWNCSGSIGASSVSCTSAAVISAGGSGNPITVRVRVADGLSDPALTNSVDIAGGGEPAGLSGNNSAQDTVGLGGVARISGTVWADANLDDILDTGEKGQRSWRVELLLNGVVVASTNTANDGTYVLDLLSPGSGYELVFRDPVNGDPWGIPVANEDGNPATPGARDNPSAPVTTNAGNPAGAQFGPTSLTDLVLFAGDDILQQSLPLDPALIPRATAIPTMPQWAMLLMCILLALVGCSAIYGRKEYN